MSDLSECLRVLKEVHAVLSTSAEWKTTADQLGAVLIEIEEISARKDALTQPDRLKLAERLLRLIYWIELIVGHF